MSQNKYASSRGSFLSLDVSVLQSSMPLLAKTNLGISQLGSLNCVALDNKYEFPLGWCVGWLHWHSRLPHVPLIPRAHVEEQQYRGVPCSWCREGAREGESKLMSSFGASAWTWMLCCLMGRWPKQSPG